nr:hypothetical protein [Lentzea jiangxiensis]
MIATVPAAATACRPAPASDPTAAAAHQSVAAVLSPRTDSPSRRITSARGQQDEQRGPTATTALVRRTVIRERYCRSKPISAPRPMHPAMRNVMSKTCIVRLPSSSGVRVTRRNWSVRGVGTCAGC